MSFPGRVEKGTVVLEEPLPLPDGTPVRIEETATAPDFWRSFSLDELATRQGVSAVGSLGDLLGGWPLDELHDEFEEVFLGWRERDRDQRP